MERAADPFLVAPPPRRSDAMESPTYPSAQEDLVPAGVQLSSKGPEEFLTPAEVRRRCSAGSCLVLCGRAVYDVSGFVRRHPGGERLLRENAGQDVSALLRGPPHQHSENALRWLEQYRVGTLLGEESDSREDPMPQFPRLRTAQHVEKNSRTTNYSNKDAAFTAQDPDNDLVDWSKPLLWQVGHLRDKYDVWVHQPVDRPIRLFHSDFIESCSKTAWYVVLSVWVPVLLYLFLYCYTAMANEDTRLAVVSTEHSVPVHKLFFLFLFLLGVFIWSLLEYCIHRFVFHMKAPASSYLLITLHFLLHGVHHKSPYDSSRLVFPPMPASLLFGAVYGLTHLVLPNIIAKSFVSGVLCGYIIYDMTHYYLHYGAPPEGTYLYGLKTYHVKHHFKHQKSGFGITSTLWDHPFNTLIPEDTEKKR